MLSRADITRLIRDQATAQGVDPDLALGIAFAGEGTTGDTLATSPKGAQGIMQLMPATAARFGVTDRTDPAQNIAGGVKYLRFLQDTFPGDRERQIAAYNAGEGAVQRYRGIPPYRETQSYVQRVMRFLGFPPSVAEASTLDDEMARERQRARGQQQDDVSESYLATKNAQTDAELARELGKLQAPTVTPSPTTPAPAQAPASQSAPAAVSWTERLGADALQVVGGARDAFVSTMQTLNLLGDWMRERGIGPSGTLQITVPEVPRAETVEGELIRGATQFLTAFLPATRLVGALGLVGTLSSGTAAGALADFAAFDPQSPRMANLINDLVPALKNPITTYLAAQPDDSEAEGRFKNTLEGLGLGALTNGLFYAVRAMRQAKQLTPASAGGGAPGTIAAAPGATADPLMQRAPTVPRQLAELSDLDIEKAVAAELEAATAAHTTALQSLRDRLSAIGSGDTDTIQAVLKDAKAVVAEDGSVALGRGQHLRRFDTHQAAAQYVTAQRLTRLEGQDPYRPINALRRALGEGTEPGPQARVPQETLERFSQRPPTPTVQLVDRATEATVLPYQSMQVSGAAEALPITGKTAHINFARVHTSDDIKQVLATVGQLLRGEAETQRRGTQTLAEIAQASERSPYRQLDRILGLTPGSALNAEDVYAVRQTWVSAADRLHTLAQQAATGDTAAYEQFLQQYVITANIHVAATGVRGEAGRALRIFGVEMPAAERQYLDALAQAMAQGLEAPTTADAVQTVAARLAAIPTKEQLAKLLVDSQQVTRTDMFTELWYGALLSSPPTHVVNALDGALRVAWSIPERYLTTLTGNPREIVQNFQAATAFTYGLKQGLQEAWQYAREAFRTGLSQFGEASKVDTPLRPAITAATLGVGEESLLHGAVDLLGAVIRSPGRALMSVDEFFKVVNYRMALHEQAFRQATEEGLSGPDLARRLVALVEEPLPSLKDRATAWANSQTLATPLTQEGAPFEALGRATQHLVDAREDFLPLKIVLPFVRTPFNIARFAAEHTPILGNLSMNVNRALVAGGAEGALARSKMALGTTTLALFGLLAAEDVITGKAPSDPALRATWDRLGKQEYSVRIGNTYYAYNRADLIGLPMGLAADFVTMARETPMHRLETVAGAMLAAVFNGLTSKTYLQGLAEAIDAVTPGRGETETQSGVQFEQFLSRRIASIVPSVLGLGGRMLDPVQRDVRTLLDTVLARLVPGYSTTLPASLDLWGRARLRAEPVGPDLLSPILSREYQPDAVDEELLRQQTPLKMPERVLRMTLADRKESDPVELTPQQYAQYVKLSAGIGLEGTRPLKETLRTLMASAGYRAMSDGPRGGKSLLVQQLVQQYQEAGKAALRAQDPAFHALLTQQELARKLRLTPQGQETLRNLQIGVPR